MPEKHSARKLTVSIAGAAQPGMSAAKGTVVRPAAHRLVGREFSQEFFQRPGIGWPVASDSDASLPIVDAMRIAHSSLYVTT